MTEIIEVPLQLFGICSLPVSLVSLPVCSFQHSNFVCVSVCLSVLSCVNFSIHRKKSFSFMKAVDKTAGICDNVSQSLASTTTRFPVQSTEDGCLK